MLITLAIFPPQVVQRFPERDWPDIPFVHGLDRFCQVTLTLTRSKMKNGDSPLENYRVHLVKVDSLMKVTCCPSAALSDFNLSNSQASMTSDIKSRQVNFTGITQIRGDIDDKTPDPDFISIGGIMFRTLNSSADLSLELSVVLMLTNDSAGRLACVSGKARATILHLHPHRRRG